VAPKNANVNTTAAIFAILICFPSGKNAQRVFCRLARQEGGKLPQCCTLARASGSMTMCPFLRPSYNLPEGRAVRAVTDGGDCRRALFSTAIEVRGKQRVLAHAGEHYRKQSDGQHQMIHHLEGPHGLASSVVSPSRFPVRCCYHRKRIICAPRKSFVRYSRIPIIRHDLSGLWLQPRVASVI
jgi:hypothetical protein